MRLGDKKKKSNASANAVAAKGPAPGRPPPGYGLPPTHAPLSYGPSSSDTPRPTKGGPPTRPPGPTNQAPGSRRTQVVEPTVNRRARQSMIWALIGLIPFLIALPGLMAILQGFIALKEIKASKGAERGQRLAWFGILLGAAEIAVLVVFLIVNASHSQS